MNAEWKQLWCEALQSGQYSQTRRSLRDQGGFCCLGVLCDLTKLGTWQEEGQYIVSSEGRPYRFILPPAVMKLVGLGERTADCLGHMNDAERLSFPQIADWIDRNL